jgi:hypothetical protein
VHDGEEIAMGKIVMRFLETPGHTPEGICILVTDTETPDQPQKLLTGDTLFTCIHLEEGVLRAVTGAGVKQARDRFRLNTPVAAIGVRGTDFTVVADAGSSRVSVQSGGVVMTPLGGDCAIAAVGSCEGGRAAELYAGQPHLMLQLNKGELRPTLAPVDQRAPDRVSPPAPGEGSLSKSTPAQQDAAAPQVGEVVSLNRTHDLADEDFGLPRSEPRTIAGVELNGVEAALFGQALVADELVIAPSTPCDSELVRAWRAWHARARCRSCTAKARSVRPIR